MFKICPKDTKGFHILSFKTGIISYLENYQTYRNRFQEKLVAQSLSNDFYDFFPNECFKSSTKDLKWSHAVFIGFLSINKLSIK